MSKQIKYKHAKVYSGLTAHASHLCDCFKQYRNGKFIQPNFCVYQSFLDGWDYTPDVGNGKKRGEIFTPRFVVDKMIALSGIIPHKAVYNFEYSGSIEEVERSIRQRTFEPAVGTGNFVATILWHKLEYANFITSSARKDFLSNKSKKNKEQKNKSQLTRYQVYTLEALGSIYINDVDAGNLQAVKNRFLRLNEIDNKFNVDFWIKHVKNGLSNPISKSNLSKCILSSIKESQRNWGYHDNNEGIMNVLYRKHTGLEPPSWLVSSWKYIIDENTKLFDFINLDDHIVSGIILPGYKNVIWNFWRFTYDKNGVNIFKTKVPLYRQILESRLRLINSKIDINLAHRNRSITNKSLNKNQQSPVLSFYRLNEFELKSLIISLNELKFNLSSVHEFEVCERIRVEF
jgi:hypothetical protein